VRLATVRHDGGTRAARIDGPEATLLNYRDVGELLGSGTEWATAAEAAGQTTPASSLRYASLILNPSKIVCVGLNYRTHIEELGERHPEYPTLFGKFAGSLIGASDPIRLPRVSSRVDWEVELVAVIGAELRYGDEESAARAIAGFTVGNDISVRDFQARTPQWLQGKTFDSTTPVGPYLVSADETGTAPDLEIRCEVDGRVRQRSRTSDLLFGPAELVAYISQIITLKPGDLIFTGTPGGVGQGQKPPVFLAAGQSVASVVDGIGAMLNPCVPDDEC
jgi:acylpyruvate hydrolase